MNGEITVARATLTVASSRQGASLAKSLPSARVRNRSSLPSNASVYAGVRRKPRSRKSFELVVVFARPQPAILAAAPTSAATAATAAKLPLRLSGSVRYRWGRVYRMASVFSGSGAPRAICDFRLGKTTKIRAGLVAGAPISYPKGSNAKPLAVLAQALAAAWGRPYDPAFRTAVTGGGGFPGLPPSPPPPSPSPPSSAKGFTWTYADAQKLAVVGDVVSDAAFDRLEVRLPFTTFPDPQGPPNEGRRVIAFTPPARLSQCSVTTSATPDDTLVRTGGAVPAGVHERVQVQTDPPPADRMGGKYLLTRGGTPQGPFQIDGP